MRNIIVLVICLTLLSCAGQRPVGWEEKISGGDPPEWTNYPSKFDNKEAKAFCGVSHNSSSEAIARDNALENARKQIIDAMGSYGKHVIDEVISSVGTAWSVLDPTVIRDDATNMVSEAVVKTRAKEYHIEKWSRIKRGGEVEIYHKAYVFVLWNNRDADEAVIEAIRRQGDVKRSEEEQRNLERALSQMERLKSEDW